jgi:hypothetical protein
MNKLRIFLSKAIRTIQSHEAGWLALLRSGVALTLIFKILSEHRYINMLYGSEGLISLQINSFSKLAFIPTLNDIYIPVSSLCAESHFLTLFFLIQLLFAVFLLLGFTSRFSAFMCWSIQVIVFNSGHLMSYGFDAILLSLLFYTMIFPTGLSMSIDNVLSPDRTTDRSMLGSYHKVIQLHICLIYFANGISKISGHSWQDGSGLWDAINQPQFQSLLTSLLRKVFTTDYIAAIVSWAIIIIEISYPFVIWIKDINKAVLLMILLLHISIALVLGLWLFAFVMIVFNMVAFGQLLWKKNTLS